MTIRGTEIPYPSTATETNSEGYNAKEDIEELKGLIKEQGEKFELLGKYIDTRLAERDNKLLKVLHEIQETKQIAAAEQNRTLFKSP